MPNSIIVVTGASGAGKTAAVSRLESRGLPRVKCFLFDSIGVPAPEAMDRDYGGPERWQVWATHWWIKHITASEHAADVAVLDAQIRPSTVLSVPGIGAAWRAAIVLFDCSAEVRAARLCGPRGQPELASTRMEHWAAYLRGQADALRLPIVETTTLTIDQAATRLEALVLPWLGGDAPAA